MITVLSIIIIAITPLILYIAIFHAGLSEKESNWEAFGSYVGGIYGALGFFAVAYSIYMTKEQFQTQHEDEVFYKSMEGLQTRVLFIPKKGQDDSTETSIAKAAVETLNKELENQTPDMALRILCNNPNLIPDTNLSTIVDAVNLNIKNPERQISSTVFLDEVNSRQEPFHRSEYLKCILGGVGFQSHEIKRALTAAGYTSFYKAGFEHRKLFYEHAWGTVNSHYGEEINLYIKKLDFILNHIAVSKRRSVHKKYLLAHISKYDIALLFYYALTYSDFDIVKLLFRFDLHGEVRREECRYLLFDCPSEEKVLADLEFIRKRLKINT
ncbi:MAG: hypothetical protein HGB12_16235 [Bacteroidetes bacterium]|nr:hypothetical protein [Bacteroidota bacterium]